jgi:hypothetical protein
MTGVKFDDAHPALPPAHEVTTLGNDVFGYEFSPDEKRLAYAYQDESCAGEGPNAVGYVNLETGENITIAGPAEATWFTAGDWSPDSRVLRYSTVEYDGVLPDIFLYDVAGAETTRLTTGLPPDEGYTVASIYSGQEVVYSIVKDLREAAHLYSGTLADGQVIQTNMVAAFSIDALQCEDTLFYVAHNDKSQLYSLAMHTGAASVLLVEADEIELLDCGTPEN